jgi:hypothetical protein
MMGPMQPGPAASPTDPTDSLLLYLVADRILPAPRGFFTIQEPVPCRMRWVGQADLAALLFASAFAGLQRRGLVRLEVGVFRTFLIYSHHVRATSLGADERPGLEGGVLKAFGREITTSVPDLIQKWFRWPRSDAAAAVIRAVKQEAEACELYREVDLQRGAIGRLLLGRTMRQPNCERIGLLAPQAEAAMAAWHTLRVDQPQLFDLLNRDCAAAIEANHAQSSHVE